MKFVLIFGPQAVGKMSVGQELAKLTELKLFHNHMTIELFHQFFGYDSETMRLSNIVRKELFEAFAKSDQYGLIFTFVWAFDLQTDWDYVEQISHIFKSNGADLYYVELEADLEERLIRNKTPNRLQEKPSKRNVERSEIDLLKTMDKHRLNSEPGEITFPNYLRINNTNLSATEVAIMIKQRFSL